MITAASKILYIIGPYRSDSENGVLHNIMNAYRAMESCWKAGIIPICPHTNSMFTGGLIPDEEILRGYRKVVSRCDGVILLEGYRESNGSMDELQEAIQHRLEIWVIDTHGSPVRLDNDQVQLMSGIGRE